MVSWRGDLAVARAVLCALALAIAAAAAQAKLSMYEPAHSPARIAAKVTKLHECRLDRLSFVPIADVVARLARPDAAHAPVEVADSPRPATPPSIGPVWSRPPPGAPGIRWGARS